jgi:hypothetical protein
LERGLLCRAVGADGHEPTARLQERARVQDVLDVGPTCEGRVHHDAVEHGLGRDLEEIGLPHLDMLGSVLRA